MFVQGCYNESSVYHFRPKIQSIIELSENSNDDVITGLYVPSLEYARLHQQFQEKNSNLYIFHYLVQFSSKTIIPSTISNKNY